jgi:hypothetical protein
MKVGDLVIHYFAGNELGRVPADKQVGIITHLWAGGAVSVLFKDGEYDVAGDDLEVISEGR